MQDATINDIRRHIAKLVNRRARLTAVHGRTGRGGSLIDSTENIAKIDRQLADWHQILAFAETDGM